MQKSVANLDLDLLRTFATIADLKSFTRAAERLGRQQSTLSLQIQRLEQNLGCTLLVRSPRTMRLTPVGERFLASAQRLLELNDEILGGLREPEMQGVVRLGTPEDFASRHLPAVLSRFAQAYPSVALEVTCDLTLNLLHKFRKGAFDLALIKREPTSARQGTLVWREPLVWVAASAYRIQDDEPIALVVSPTPCVYRKRATIALNRARRRWRVAYTCGSLAGSLAAVQARLGIAVLPKDMVPAGFRVIDGAPLPSLKDTEIALLRRDRLPPAADRLRDHIVRSLGASHASADATA